MAIFDKNERFGKKLTKIGQIWRTWTKMDILDKIEHGQNLILRTKWKIYTKMDNLNIINFFFFLLEN